MNVPERSGRVLEPQCVVSLSKTHINPSLVLQVQSRNTRPYITERLLMDVKNQKQDIKVVVYLYLY